MPHFSLLIGIEPVPRAESLAGQIESLTDGWYSPAQGSKTPPVFQSYRLNVIDPGKILNRTHVLLHLIMV